MSCNGTIESHVISALDNPYRHGGNDLEGIMRAMPDRFTRTQTQHALSRLARKRVIVRETGDFYIMIMHPYDAIRAGLVGWSN